MAEEGKVFSLRTSTESFAQFAAEAKSQGVSINQGINDWLDAYFNDTWNPDRVFASRALFGLAKLLSAAMQAAAGTALNLDTGSPVSAREWFDNPYAFDQAVSAAVVILEGCRPKGDRKPLHPSVDDAENKLKLRIGEVRAKNLLAEIAGSEEGDGSLGDRLCNDLDPSVINNIKARTGGKKK